MYSTVLGFSPHPTSSLSCKHVKTAYPYEGSNRKSNYKGDGKWVFNMIYKGDPRTPKSPYVMASSAMELILGVFGFLLTSNAETNANKIGPWSFSCCAAYQACLSSTSDRSIYAQVWRILVAKMTLKTRKITHFLQESFGKIFWLIFNNF